MFSSFRMDKMHNVLSFIGVCVERYRLNIVKTAIPIY